jgi:hypothetical protein
VKLPQLLSQYLYQTKKLDLPGIGSFTLDAGTAIPQDSDRIGQVPGAGIIFRNANIALADDNLITYIKEGTGKMKSLAAADLDFYLTTGRQLLNIGKPFYLEGIGTLLKNKEGLLEFTPGDYLSARLEDHAHHDRRGATGHDETGREEPRNARSRQTLLLIGLIAGLIVIGWGGYYLYKRNNFVEPTSENRATVIPDTTISRTKDTPTALHPAGDSSSLRNASPAVLEKKDTAKADASAQRPVVTPPLELRDPVPGEGEMLYRFVILQTASKGHALRRYNQLLGYQLNIRMAQKDSAFFKLYFPIAAAAKDTTRIKDSLADVYAAHVSIEQ